MPELNISTNLDGCALGVSYLAQVNQNDALASPDICKALVACFRRNMLRHDAEALSLFYLLDPGPEEWSNFRALLERSEAGRIIADCEDLTGICIAAEYAYSAQMGNTRLECRVEITQPHDGAIAHAYYRVRRSPEDSWILRDPSVVAGMDDPGADWYGVGNVSTVIVPRLIHK